MDELIERFKERHPQYEAKRVQATYGFGDEGRIETLVYYVVSGIEGNADLEIALRDDEDIARFEELLVDDLILFQDFVGCRMSGESYILLSPVSPRFSPYFRRREEMSPICIDMNYFGNSLTVRICSQSEDTPFLFLVEHARQLHRRFRSPFIALVGGLTRQTDAGLESDIRNILTSVLFDLEYTYGIGLETVSFDSLQLPRRRYKKNFPSLPVDSIPMVYKEYIPELLEYYHAGEKVDYLPFRYVCYFHVLEYFSDKSAYHVVSEEIRNMLLRPDFHQNVNSYVSRAIQIVKKESERNITDKIKLNRVLRQFVVADDVRSFLDEADLMAHFEHDCEMQCSKPLTLPALDWSSESQFYDSLTRRIYSLRCSIVHSNPDFEDSKSVPFVPTGDNLEALRCEILLISEISRVVIINSARN